MRRLASLLVLLASACGSAGPAPPGNAPAAVNETRMPANHAAPAPQLANQAEPGPVPDDPDLSGLSPRQRRAYEQGYRDCSAGRYDPDPYPEAYRIGCGAAHDRAESGRPQG
jgi:hypothetical protein